MKIFGLMLLLEVINGSPVTTLNASNSSNPEKRQVELPQLKLPYGTWRAAKHDSKNDIYIFRNIRYAAASVGKLRWAKPAPPPHNATLHTGAQGGTCYQSLPASMLTAALGSGLADIANAGGDGGLLADLVSSVTSSAIPLLGGLLKSSPGLANTLANLLAEQDAGKLMGGEPSSEDCLFLDVVVPGKALRGEAKLPVVNWIYGGAYIVGSKDGMYDGYPLVKQSKGGVIYVVGNYRLGAFGFLGGATVEKEGQPNAGFWDQRFVLEWIQKHIAVVGGDPNNVSVWGESAGAGSILHHLAAFGGKETALFKRAIIQSPANNLQHDRKGKVESQFRQFAALAGCNEKGLECLRSKDTKTIKKAADRVIASAPPGQFGFGPAVNGIFSRQAPDLELASGNFQKEVESIVVTHVKDEASAFVPDNLRNNKTFFDQMLDQTYGNAAIRASINKRLPLSGAKSKFKDEQERMIAYMESNLFACHVRTIAAAFKGKVWVAQYGRGSGKHGMDIKANFHNPDAKDPRDDAGFGKFASTYQDYLLSHAITGDPNGNGRLKWPKVTFGPLLGNVLNADNAGYKLIEDQKIPDSECDFWLDVWASATKSVNGVPMGGQVPSTIVA